MKWCGIGHYTAMIMTTLFDTDSVMAILNNKYIPQEPDFLHSNPSFDIYRLWTKLTSASISSAMKWEKNDVFVKEL